MPNFEDLFEEFIDKAREYADVAGKKTNEVVELGKLKYQGKQIAWEIEKTYSRLGAVVYEARKGGGDYEEVIRSAVAELDGLNRQLDEVEEKIISMRKPDFRAARNREEPEVVVEVVAREPEEAPAENTQDITGNE